MANIIKNGGHFRASSPATPSLFVGLILLLILTPCTLGSFNDDTRSSSTSRKDTFTRMSKLIRNLMACIEHAKTVYYDNKPSNPEKLQRDCFKKGLLTDLWEVMKEAFDTETENERLSKLTTEYGKLLAENNEEILRLRQELDELRLSKNDNSANAESAKLIELETCKSQVDAMKNETVRNEIFETQANETLRLLAENRELQSLTNSIQREVSRLRENFTDRDVDSELLLAAHSKHEAAVHVLVGLGADVNGRNNKTGETPLHRVAVRPNKAFGVKIIKYLIENGADAYVRDGEDYTFLDRLVQDGTTLTPTQFHEIALFVMERDGYQLFNSFGNFSIKFDTPRFNRRCSQNSPILMAVKNLQVKAKTLSLLHKGGVDFNAVNSQGGSLLLYAMAGKRGTKFMSELIALGVDPKHRDIFGQTLLHEAASFGGVDELTFFLDVGIQVNSVDRAGDTPLHDLFSYGFYNMVDTTSFLIDNGADTKLKNNEGKTAYDIALTRNALLEKAKLLQMLAVGQ